VGFDRKEKCCPHDQPWLFTNVSQEVCYSNKPHSDWESVAELPDCAAQLQPEFIVFTPENQKLNQSFVYGNVVSAVKSLKLNESRPVFVVKSQHILFIINISMNIRVPSIHGRRGFGGGFHHPQPVRKKLRGVVRGVEFSEKQRFFGILRIK